MISDALFTVGQLNIADLLVHGPRSTHELASETGSNEDGLYRVMRALASVGVFTEVGLRYFALTPAAECLRTDRPDSWRDMVVWIADPFHMKTWSDMPYSVATGKPAIDHVSGKPIFEFLQSEPEIQKRFDAAMTNYSAMVMPGVVEAYDFSGINTLVDVAGGHGFLLTSILKNYPGMKGVVFDMEHVIEGTRATIDRVGLHDRCKAVAGDFFQSVPPGGDAYIMKSIIHDWDDEPAIRILKNVRHALEGKDQGKVLLVEMVVGPPNSPGPVTLIDLEMLLLTGGRERTEEEYRELFARAGFESMRVIPTNSGMCVIEAVPKQ